MSTTLTIARREFRSNFDSPLAYVVICLGLIMLGFVFFELNGGFWQADRASLTALFAQAPRGLSFLVIPVVTMRLLAEEKRSGTLEPKSRRSTVLSTPKLALVESPSRPMSPERLSR